MSGWIKLHRSIKSHWVYEPHRPRTYREAWEDILLTVNWELKKVLVNGQLIDCKEGQSLNSLQSWAKQFNWSVAKVRHFFKLLENDGMITTEGLQYTTRLTICNWATYQGETTDEKQTEHITERTTKNTPKATTKEDKELKEGKEDNSTPAKSPKIEFKPFVRLRQSEYDYLLSQYGEDAASWMITKLSDYKESTGKNYKSDAAAIRSWVVGEWLKAGSKQPINPAQTDRQAEQAYIDKITAR